MNDGTTGGIVDARPRLRVAGQENSSLADGLLSLVVTETSDGLYRCEATIGNIGLRNNDVDFLYFDRSTLDFGKDWQVQLSVDGQLQTIFDGRITGLEAHFPAGAAARITVLAEDRFQDLRMTRRTRTFEDVSDAAVINQIAGDHGLTPSVDVSGPTYAVLAQVNQSDLAFLRERARSIDAELWVEGRTLHATTRSRRNGGTSCLSYPTTLREFSALADLAHQRTSVTVNGWDVGGKQGLQHEATAAVLGAELNGGDSGASILRSALGERKETLVHTRPLSQDEAQSTAEAYFKAISRRFITGHGVAEPDARLRVGTFVDLSGLGALLTGKYYLVEVQHLFDGRQGLRTEFAAERPGLGRAAP